MKEWLKKSLTLRPFFKGLLFLCLVFFAAALLIAGFIVLIVLYTGNPVARIDKWVFLFVVVGAFGLAFSCWRIPRKTTGHLSLRQRLRKIEWRVLIGSILIGIFLAFPFGTSAHLVKPGQDDCNHQLEGEKQLVKIGGLPLGYASLYNADYRYINGEGGYPDAKLKLKAWQWLLPGLQIQDLTDVGGVVTRPPSSIESDSIQWWANGDGELCLRVWNSEYESKGALTTTPDYNWEIRFGWTNVWWRALYWLGICWVLVVIAASDILIERKLAKADSDNKPPPE